MKYLVTGATSGLGRNAVEALLAQGCDVRATGRDENAGAELTALRRAIRAAGACAGRRCPLRCIDTGL